MSYDSFYCCFRTAQAPKILAGSGALPSETKIQLEKNNTSQPNLFLKKRSKKHWPLRTAAAVRSSHEIRSGNLPEAHYGPG
jgi:hypothetical protein